MAAEYPYVWTRKHLPAKRQGQRCRIYDKGPLAETCRIQFKDGSRFVVQRGGLAKAT